MGGKSKTMTSRERVMAVVNGGRADQTPTMFTMHFPAGLQTGEEACRAHLRFFQESESDIGKIMNENLLRSDIVVNTPEDLAQERVNAETRRSLDKQVDMVKRLVDQIAGEKLVLATIHGPMVSIHHMSGRKGFFVENLDFYRTCEEKNPAGLRAALGHAAEALCELTRRCVEEAGADGIYLAALGAERSLFTREEYGEIVRPFDCMVLEAAKSAKGFHLLHICKKNVDVNRFLDYPVEAFNWEMCAENATLEQALAAVPADRTVLGGFSNERGALLSGTAGEIEAETWRLLEKVQGRRWILGAGCTLPTGIDPARLRAVAQASKSFSRRKNA